MSQVLEDSTQAAEREQEKGYEAFTAQAKLIYPSVAIPSFTEWVREDRPSVKDYYGKWYDLEKQGADGRYHAHKKEKQKEEEIEMNGKQTGEPIDKPGSKRGRAKGEKTEKKEKKERAPKPPKEKKERVLSERTAAARNKFSEIASQPNALPQVLQQVQAAFSAQTAQKSGGRKSDPTRFAVEIPLTHEGESTPKQTPVSIMWFASAASGMSAKDFSRIEARQFAKQLGLEMQTITDARTRKSEADESNNEPDEQSGTSEQASAPAEQTQTENGTEPPAESPEPELLEDEDNVELTISADE